MHHWRAVSTGFALVIMLALIGGGLPLERAAAQEVGPQAAALALGTAFTYQGRLLKGGAPVSDACNMRFRLFDDPAAGAQVGATLTLPDVPISGGLFTVALDFGQGAFNGNARWLEIAAQCVGDVAYVPLTPRQPLTPAPYALALPGLYTQENATSPNLIGGFSGNSVITNVVGATIGGGGANNDIHRVTDNYGTVGGGSGNRAGDNAGTVTDATYATVGGGANNVAGEFSSTVGGGNGNNATGDYSTVGGGSGNLADDNYATIGGGSSNVSSGGLSTVAGGSNNDALGSYTTIGGGNNNQATTNYATVGGGSDNVASNGWATIAGGETNTASGQNATVAGGEHNTASASYATVAGGYQAVASHFAEQAYSSGMFANFGDAQASFYVLRGLSTSAGLQELFLNGSNARLTIASNSVWAFEVLVAARTSGAIVQSSAGYRITGVIENAAGTVAFIGTPTVTVLGEDVAAWNVTVTDDNTNDALTIHASGTTGTNVRWVAAVRTVQVTFN